ncbi:glycosyltransferase [Roseobacter sp. MED193]|uniref:glycosyltransferase family 2 protein n=1 Tax=Roseobacter sp. MED193 TaxID=314262 RepID=UPI0018DCB3B4|nr:glycosyltransferase [Roseobacter sp. MED193]
MEIIVSDNCSLDDTADVVASFNDPRLKYIRTPERTSMRANFEFALRSSTGDFVSVIGDDDGYLPAQFPALRSILEKHQPDCLYWDLPAYTWPAKGESGLVKLRRRSAFGLPKAIEADVFRENLLEARIEQTNSAPSVYHGVASRSCLERIACPDGTCFAGSIPDIYFSYRSLFAGGNMLRAAHPFSIAGQSNASNGAAHNRQKESDITWTCRVLVPPQVLV